MPRSKLGEVPEDSKQYCSLVRRRFRTEVPFTGHEAQEFAALIAQDCILLLPFHLLFMSFCHVLVLLYASDLGLPLGYGRRVANTMYT